jgi:cyclopropane-fatty-acyl-phospholipid synthase
MNTLFRYLLMIPETLFYGPAYAMVNRDVRTAKPLDPKVTWDWVTHWIPPGLNWVRLNYPPSFLRRAVIAAKLRQDHLLGISQHYDVSNEFYELFLDKKFMFYTCADFHSEHDTLEQAQTNKANHLLSLIQPKAGEQILDLGCGWGAMMRHIVEHTGDQENIVGYTLSREQVKYAQEKLGLRVEFKNFITCEYPKHGFDKIYSIGSWEHVREADLESLNRKLYDALAPGGRIVHHFFTYSTDRVPTSLIAAQIFFPGSLPASHVRQVKEFERAGFRIVGRTLHDYRPTLRAWFDNLSANVDRAIELVGVRTFNQYLNFFPASHRFFDEGDAVLIRYVLEKK